MFHPIAGTTQLLTYTWIEYEANTPEINCDNNSATARLPFLSQGKWHSSTDSYWSRLPTNVNNLLGFTNQLPTMAKTNTWPSLDIMLKLPEPSSSKEQWENMREFHLSTLLWPSQERQGQTKMEGNSPLIWTVLYPPLAEALCQTYTWNGHLDNYMPWNVKQTGGMQIRPPIILHAQWNI